jgi:HK97 family phage prohead protease
MSELYTRAYPAVIERTGPRTLTGRLVPYNVSTHVADPTDEPGKFDIYREGFRRGAFDPQVMTREKGVLNKIGLIHRHEGGLGFLGPFVALRNADDGLWGDVTILPSKADDVGALLDAGVDELSIEFRLPRADHTSIDDQGVRWRTRAHLDQVALEPKGAYSSAAVMAYRAEMDEDAKAQLEAKADEERLAAESIAKGNAEAEADERRRRWAEYADRVDVELAKQAELVSTYGVTAPRGYRRLEA